MNTLLTLIPVILVLTALGLAIVSPIRLPGAAYPRPCRALSSGASLLIICTGLLSCSTKNESVVKPEMVGKWTGKGKIIVDWCDQEHLPVQLAIAAGGKVTGTVGDASLQDGEFKQNRGAIGRKLNIKTDYIIRGNLSGEIISSHNIKRSRVSIPLNFNNGAFSGGLGTDGSKFGGKEKGDLAVADLELRKEPPP